ncbi:helix-turn-helix domain-containing protein [Candidatus Nitrospira allomarina]|uniref:Helix-turn-helix domain-containing protein n=1 Tax=Candidatus Nitrospira allomarina TaxID=3020900 RepID=A0AA96GBJ8_9BACT|nr:helix-turn-helix domain-containing protein [Candidatus Nitrospira allomarina]WNM59034.1 helix-turn-helix domain-containing protein [Candidatus Nitrospira allomarina]
MSLNSSHIRFALLTQDPDLKSRVQVPDLQNTITVVDDCSSLEAAMRSQQFTGVILDESGKKFFPALSALNGQLNLSKTFIYAGPLPAWSTMNQIRQVMGDQPSEEGAIDPKDVSLASYVEKKLGDFVRAMNVGSGKNLYPTLMRAVERPLIELALRETHGNQIKAARLLGLNRNTLRKKITEFQISVNQLKQSTAGKRKKTESDSLE